MRHGRCDSVSSDDASDIVRSPPAKQNSYHNLLDTFDDSESEEEVLPPRKKNKRLVVPIEISDEENTQPVEEDDDEEDVPITPRNRRRVHPLAMNESDESAGGSDAESSSRSSLSTTRKRRTQTKQDLDDDVEFLRDSSPPKSARSVQKTARNSALEALKKKRQRQQRRVSAVDSIDIQSVSSDEEDDDDLIYPDAEMQEQTYYDGQDDDFLDDEHADETEVAQLPLEIRLQSAKPAELFRHVIEWMVQKRLNPAFDANDSVFGLAFRKLNDFAHGMGSSKFQSSAWNAPFLRSLKARPNLDEFPFDNPDQVNCEACNRTRHPATFVFQFTGNPYSNESMEDVSDDEDFAQETALPPEDKEYHMGKHCARNARIAHALAHWRYHLYEWTVQWLEDEGYLTPDKVVQRDRWQTKRRADYAYGIVDKMNACGKIKELYHDFKVALEEAQNQPVSYALWPLEVIPPNMN